MNFEEMQLCTNETILKMIDLLKERLRKAERMTIIVVSMMLIQTCVIVGGVLYFLNSFQVEVSEEYSTEQTIEGEGAVINNVDGTNNTVTNNLGGVADGESNSN